MKNRKLGMKALSFILIVFTLINTNNTSTATTVNTNTIESYSEENIEYTINSLIQSFEESGLTKTNLSKAVNTYKRINKQYTNEEIANVLENSKSNIEDNDVAKDNIDSICRILRTFDQEKINSVLDKIDIDQVLNEMESGATLLQVIEKVTNNMSATEKVDLMVSILWSANILRIIFIVVVILGVYKILIRCVIYKKAGKHAWASIIPIYRDIVMLKICGINPWWLLLLLIPVIGWIILWLVHVASKFMLAEAFNKKQLYGLGLWLLWPIFESILAFSKKSKYVGIEKD